MQDADTSGEVAGSIPDHVPTELIHGLDHWNGEEFLADPMGYWDSVRQQYRVFWSPHHGGFWCLLRYEDIYEAFRRPDLFSSRYTNIPGREVRLLPISLDPPEHTRYRRMLGRPFSPQSIQRLAAKVRERCLDLVHALEGQRECDFIESFAKALPTAVFCELLGMPTAELPKFLEWNHVILHVHGDGANAQRQAQANEDLAAYLAELVQHRRSGLGDDVISQLLMAEVDGYRLTDQEVLAIAHLLFMAGLDTVTASLSWTWQFLATHPGHRQQILDDPGLIPGAVEELLRYQSIVEDSRTVVTDVEWAGVRMRAGDRVMLPTTAASRDPDAFPDPLTVDFRREPNPHIAFASGAHRCLGSHLARMEMLEALAGWHAHIPHYRLKPGARIPYHGGAIIGLDALLLELGTSA
jgi:cytochrome P450